MNTRDRMKAKALAQRKRIRYLTIHHDNDEIVTCQPRDLLWLMRDFRWRFDFTDWREVTLD